MFSANLVHLLSSFDGYKSNPCCAKEGKQGKENMCLILIPLLFPFELKIIQGLQHLNRSIEVSTMTSSKAASTVSLSGVCKNENRKWKLLFSITLLRFTINQEQMLFIQQYFVKVLLPWRKCETSLIKLEHMLMEEIILIYPTIITYSNLTWDEFLSSSPTAQTKRPPTLYSCCTASVVFWGTQFKFLPFFGVTFKTFDYAARECGINTNLIWCWLQSLRN